MKVLVSLVMLLSLAFGDVFSTFEEEVVEQDVSSNIDYGNQSYAYQMLSGNGVDVGNIITLAGKCYRSNPVIVRNYLENVFNNNQDNVSEQEISSHLIKSVSAKDDFLAFFAHYCISIDGFYKMDQEMFDVYQAAVEIKDEQVVQDLETSLRDILADTLVTESVTIDGKFVDHTKVLNTIENQ